MSYKDIYSNTLELLMGALPQSADYELKLIDNKPVYCLKGKRFISYRKNFSCELQKSIIQEHINSPSYRWKENVYLNMISLYYFMDIKKNHERIASLTLSRGIEDSYLWWRIWGVLEDGTILSPRVTRKIIKLLQKNTIESNFNGSDSLEELNDYLAEDTNIDFWDERGWDEL